MTSEAAPSGCSRDDQDTFYNNAFSRNIGLLTDKEQEKLRRASVGVAGMGGVGGLHLVTMARSGIGNFSISDFDTFEIANINRQYGARYPDFGRTKLKVMEEEALKINPFVNIKSFPEGLNKANIDDFLEKLDVVLDGLDFFNFEIRRMVFNRAREKGIHVITAGPMGYSSALLIFAPGDGMGFDEYFAIENSMTEKDKLLAFALGLAPKATQIKYMDSSKVNLDAKAGPSLAVACQLCAAIAGTEALRIILGKGGVKPAPYYFQFDPYLQTYKRGYLLWGNRNPIQKLKLWYVKKYYLGRR